MPGLWPFMPSGQEVDRAYFTAPGAHTVDQSPSFAGTISMSEYSVCYRPVWWEVISRAPPAGEDSSIRAGNSAQSSRHWSRIAAVDTWHSLWLARGCVSRHDQTRADRPRSSSLTTGQQSTNKWRLVDQWQCSIFNSAEKHAMLLIVSFSNDTVYKNTKCW